MRKIYKEVILISVFFILTVFSQEFDIKNFKSLKLASMVVPGDVAIYKICASDSFEIYNQAEAPFVGVPVFESNSGIPFNLNLLIQNNVNRLINIPMLFAGGYTSCQYYFYNGIKKMEFVEISHSLDYEDLNGVTLTEIISTK